MVVADGIQAAPERFAGTLERTAVLEEIAVLDAIDPHVGRVRGLVVRAELLRVVRRAVAAHEVELAPGEVALDLCEEAKKRRCEGPAMAVPVAEEAGEPLPVAPAQDPVATERRYPDLVAAVEVL